MIKDSDFYCQFVSYTNEKIARTTCGVTSLAMVLSAKGVFGSYKNQYRNLDDFFIFINSLHKNDLPAVKRNFQFKNTIVPVTVGLETQVALQKGDMVLVDDCFFPAFVLYKGYDHRASSAILKRFGLEGSLYENLPVDALVSIFEDKECTYFLASVKSKYVNLVDNTVSTHIVVVQKIFTDSLQNIVIEYVDPALDNYTEAVVQLNLSDFAAIYNGFGTLVK